MWPIRIPDMDSSDRGFMVLLNHSKEMARITALIRQRPASKCLQFDSNYHPVLRPRYSVVRTVPRRSRESHLGGRGFDISATVITALSEPLLWLSHIADWTP
jgi:hypothetical protein